MDGLTFSGLTSASLRAFTAGQGAGQAAAYVPSHGGPVDTVELASAVRRAEDYDDVRMTLEREMFPERIPTSLRGLLDAITRFYEEALEKARETRPDFFDKLKENSEKLLGAKDAEDLETVGQLVAASSPQDMDKFLGASEEVTQQLLAQKPEGQTFEGLQFKTSDVSLSIQPLGEGKVSVQFEGAKVQVQDTQAQGRPVVELNAKAGQFTVETPSPDA